jgi:hypothetical protein
MAHKNLENELRAMILQEHTASQRDKIITWVGTDSRRFDCLLKLFFANEKTVTQRAAWPIGYIGEHHPELIKIHLEQLVNNLLQSSLHQAVKRNTLRLLQHFEISEDLHGKLLHACIGFIENVEETVAVKAFALSILEKLSRQYPEILPEIRLLVQAQLPHQTPAFKVRARPFLSGQS